MNVTITFTSVGADITGPFDLYSNTDPYPGGTPFETNVSLASFATPGYTSTNAPAGTTEVTCVATVGCGQVLVSCDSTTTTTTTTSGGTPPTTTTTSTSGAFDLYQVCVGIDDVRSGDYVYTCYNPMWMWMRHTSSTLGVGAQLFDDEEMTTYTKGAGYIQQSSSSVIFTISSGGFVDIETEYGCSGPAVSCATSSSSTTTTTSTTSEPICTQVLDNGETLFGYSASSAYNACQAEGTVTLYGDNAAFTSATHIYSDSSCETNAKAGYYSGKGYNYVRLWTGTSFEGDDIYCPTLTTTTTIIS